LFLLVTLLLFIITLLFILLTYFCDDSTSPFNGYIARNWNIVDAMMMVTFALRLICFIFGLFVGFCFSFCCMVFLLFARVCLHVLFCLGFKFRVN
jgi:hypothetical protein